MKHFRVFIGAILVLALLSSCNRAEERDGDDERVFPRWYTEAFAWQTALPIDVIGDTYRSFILLDDGSLWAFGWVSNAREMVYAQVPFFCYGRR